MAVFEGISFYLAEKLVKDAAEVKSMLTCGGACREYYPSELVSHVITDSTPPTELGLGRCTGSLMLHSGWVIMSSRCELPLPISPFLTDKNKLFSDLVFCSSKLSRNDTERLACLVFYYGSRLQQRLDAAVTHLITMDTSGVKYESALRHSLKVVTPDWVIDSIESGRLVEVEEYQPIQRGKNARNVSPTHQENDDSTSAVLASPVRCNGECEEEEEERRDDEERRGEEEEEEERRDDEERRGEEAEEKERRDDEEAEDAEERRMVEEEGINGDEDKEEEEELKEEQEKEGSNDIVREPVEEEERSSIETMEEGDEEMDEEEEEAERSREREEEIKHLDDVIRETGVEGNMSPPTITTPATVTMDTITTATVSVETAQAMVHESPLKMDDQKVGVSAPSSSSSSQRRLLDGLVFHLSGYQECMEEGTLKKWEEVIIQYGGTVISSYNTHQCTHLLALHKKSDIFAKAYVDCKCISSAHWLNDVLTEGKLFPPRNPLHFPTAFKWQISGADNYSITLTNYTGTEREVVKDMVNITGIPYTGHLSKNTSYLICKTASGKKYDKALEWGVTVVNVSFLADIIHNGQLPAVLYRRHTRLGQPHELLGIHCYEAARLLRPWRKFMTNYSQDREELVDQTCTDMVFSCLGKRWREKEEEGKDEEGDEEEESLKRVKLDSSLQRDTPPVVMVTGISQSISKNLKMTIQQLGATVTDKPRECTHIVAPRVARTVKFLCGISVCHYLLTPEWVELSQRKGRLVNEQGFTLRDLDAEEALEMDITRALMQPRGTLLKNYCFLATANVQPSQESLREIIECAGGELLTSAQVNSRFGKTFEKIGSSDKQLLVLSTAEDVASDLCTLYSSHNIPVYNAELVLTGVLKQQLDINQNKLLPPPYASPHGEHSTAIVKHTL